MSESENESNDNFINNYSSDSDDDGKLESETSRRGQTTVIKAGRGRGRPPLSATQNQSKNSTKKKDARNAGQNYQNQQIDDQVGDGNAGNSKDQDEMDYVKQFDLDKVKTPKDDDIIKFANNRRRKVYQNMDKRQQHRFDDFMVNGFDDKKIKDLL